MSDDGIRAVAAGCAELTKLGACGLFLLTDAATTALGDGCVRLHTLDISGCLKITAEAKAVLLARNPGLTLQCCSTT